MAKSTLQCSICISQKFEFQIANLQSSPLTVCTIIACDKEEKNFSKSIEIDFWIGLSDGTRESRTKYKSFIYKKKKDFICCCFFPTFICRAKSEVLNCAIAHKHANSLSMSTLSHWRRNFTQSQLTRNFSNLSFYLRILIRSSWKFTRLWLQAARREMIAIWWNLLFTSLSKKVR